MENEDEVLITEDSDGYDMSAWYKDLVKAHTTKLPEGAITVEQFMNDTGLGEATARKILKDKMEEENDFHGRKMTVEGFKRWVFWHEEGEQK